MSTHAATATVCQVLEELLAHKGHLSTSEIARRTDTKRDTVRRVLLELAERGWVEQFDFDEGSRWRLGPELPRIGLAYLDSLSRQQANLRRDFDRATTPHEWRRGPTGSRFEPIDAPDNDSHGEEA